MLLTMALVSRRKFKTSVLFSPPVVVVVVVVVAVVVVNVEIQERGVDRSDIFQRHHDGHDGGIILWCIRNILGILGRRL